MMTNKNKFKEVLVGFLQERSSMDANDVAKDLTDIVVKAFGNNNHKAKVHINNSQAKVIVFVKGGVVQDVKSQAGIKVEVRDYDVDGVPNKTLDTDDDGDKYVKMIY